MSEYSQTSTETCQQDTSEIYAECGNQADAGSAEQAYLMMMQTDGMGNAMAQESIPTYGPPAPDDLLESEADTFFPYGPPAPSEEALRNGECEVDPFFQSPEEYREWYEWEGVFTDEDGNRYGDIEQFLVQSEDPEAWRILIARSERKQHEDAHWREEQSCPAQTTQEKEAQERAQQRGALKNQITEYGHGIGDTAQEVAQYGSTYIMNIAQQEISLPPSIENIGPLRCFVENDLLLRSRIAATPENSPTAGTAMTKNGITQSIKFALGEVFSGLSLGINDSGQATMRGTIGGEWAKASFEIKPPNQMISRFEPNKLIEVSHGGWKFKIRLDASLIKTYWLDGHNNIDLQPLNISPETQTIIIGSLGLLLAAAAMLTGTGELALTGAAGVALVGTGIAASGNSTEGGSL